MEPNHLSRREREIMNSVYARGSATVRNVQEDLADPPTAMAVRRMLHILEEKGLLKGKKDGREVVYSPVESRKRAGASALQRVIDTFFRGSIDEALATHLSRKENVSPEQLAKLQALIESARRQKKTDTKK
ncbi:MAG: BlaI/MecI/CopY family transcriptional regulator [Pirellula sp.]